MRPLDLAARAGRWSANNWKKPPFDTGSPTKAAREHTTARVPHVAGNGPCTWRLGSTAGQRRPDFASPTRADAATPERAPRDERMARAAYVQPHPRGTPARDSAAGKVAVQHLKGEQARGRAAAARPGAAAMAVAPLHRQPVRQKGAVVAP